MIHEIDLDQLAALVAVDDARFSLLTGPNVVVVDRWDASSQPPELEQGLPPVFGHVVVAVGSVAAEAPAWCDVVASRDEVDDMVDMTARSPIASVVAVQVLRTTAARPVAEGLVVESMAYSMLQAGPEFVRWRADRERVVRPTSSRSPVRVDRRDGELVITLDRPEVHNALDRRMRDAILEALDIADVDPDVERVSLQGRGRSSCSGGDLDEFGTAPDPATAHVIRLATSIGYRVHCLADRVTAVIHGATVGSGIEIAAFAGEVSARSNVRIGLPELSLGLLPGAGGTVSLPRRIGRQRTAWLLLTGRTIDADTALDWGLVDQIE